MKESTVEDDVLDVLRGGNKRTRDQTSDKRNRRQQLYTGHDNQQKHQRIGTELKFWRLENCNELIFLNSNRTFNLLI